MKLKIPSRKAAIEYYFNSDYSFEDSYGNPRKVLPEIAKSYEETKEALLDLEIEPVIYRNITIVNVNGFVKSLSRYGKSMRDGMLVGIGIFWSWDYECANHYGGNFYEYIVSMEAIVDERNVDVIATIMINMKNRALEREIRMVNGSRCLLRSASVYGYDKPSKYLTPIKKSNWSEISLDYPIEVVL
jgi:hypothetical protein